MKPMNCGQCGLEPVARLDPLFAGEGKLIYTGKGFTCPVHWNSGLELAEWNAAQFAALNDRIYAVALSFAAHDVFERGWDNIYIKAAKSMIASLDADTRERWAEMQKGE